jgi:hypothetical protein
MSKVSFGAEGPMLRRLARVSQQRAVRLGTWIPQRSYGLERESQFAEPQVVQWSTSL